MLLKQRKKIFLLLFFFYLIGFQQQGYSQITYIANEGIFITVNNKKILIDALHRQTPSVYQHTPANYTTAIINAHSPFDSIQLFLITHGHPDHFKKDYLQQFLKNHRACPLIAPTEVIDTLLKGDSQLLPQLYAANLPKGGFLYELEGIKVTAIPLQHIGKPEKPPLDHFGYLLDIDGLTIFHGADAVVSQANWKIIRRFIKKVDYVVLPYDWFYEAGLAFIKKEPIGKHYIAVHVMQHEKAKMQKKLKGVLPSLRVFTKVGEVVNIK